jgi:hypothetical protein
MAKTTITAPHFNEKMISPAVLFICPGVEILDKA